MKFTSKNRTWNKFLSQEKGEIVNRLFLKKLKFFSHFASSRYFWAVGSGVKNINFHIRWSTKNSCIVFVLNSMIKVARDIFTSILCCHFFEKEPAEFWDQKLYTLQSLCFSAHGGLFFYFKNCQITVSVPQKYCQWRKNISSKK